MDKIYVLSEEFEGTDGVREFRIIAASYNLNDLRRLKNKIVLEDEYKLFEENGIMHQSDDAILTEYKNSRFVGYFITEEDII